MRTFAQCPGQAGSTARVHSVIAGSRTGVEFSEREEVRDLLPDLQSAHGYVLDKVESFAIDAAGVGFVITDNDGVADSSGETMFWSIGTLN